MQVPGPLHGSDARCCNAPADLDHDRCDLHSLTHGAPHLQRCFVSRTVGHSTARRIHAMRTTFLIAGVVPGVVAVVAIIWAKMPADEIAHPLRDEPEQPALQSVEV